MDSYRIGTGGVSPGVMWLWREGDHSPVSSAEVKNGRASLCLCEVAALRPAGPSSVGILPA
jgi:hypothetical protein